MKYEIKAELLDRIIEKQDELISKLQSMVDSGQDYDRDYHEIYVELQTLKSEFEGGEKKELFEKVYIKTEADLPEEDGRYSVHNRGNINTFDYHDSTWMSLYTDAWLRDYDWYLRPVSYGREENTCKKCGKEMINQVEPKYLCMNPECDDYIKVQKPTFLPPDAVDPDLCKVCHVTEETPVKWVWKGLNILFN